MKQGQSYINHQLNTSVYRNSCKFSKAERFKPLQFTPTDFNYHVSSRKQSRTTGLGYGQRPGFQNYQAPSPNTYNVSQFPRDKRATTLGVNREEAIFGNLINSSQKKAELPSPDAYNLAEEKGKSFSLRMKLPGQTDTIIRKRVPGPGQYHVPQITPNGRYASSRYKNTRSISFGQPQRPGTSQSQRTGPGSYDIFNMDSSFSQRKIKQMKKNTSKNFGTGRRLTLQDKSKRVNPGPGNYNSFSCFGDKVFVPNVS